MKIKVSDYIAQLLVENGITSVFSVVGGGAMHLNDSFGNCDSLQVTYNHHEQASAIAAESYARVNGVPAIVCVTTGPGGTNAITGVLCAWQDNIPMIVISGQVRCKITVESSGLPLRQNGEQEHYIVDTVKSITKYAIMIRDITKIRYHIEKAIYLATHGRKGPCWLDIPLDIQGAVINTETQKPFVNHRVEGYSYSIKRVVRMLSEAKRPVIIAGSTLLNPTLHNTFVELKDKLGIPVVAATSMSSILPYSSPLYYGTFGVFGGRSGNFIIQNSDLLLVLGCRMTYKHIGFNHKNFAPYARKIVVDIDNNELKKDLIKIDVPICADVYDFMLQLLTEDIYISQDVDWIKYCDTLKDTFPIYDKKFEASKNVNPYYFSKILRDKLPDGSIRVLGNSCACVCMQQMGIDKPNQKMWTNVNCGTMGYDLPAAIGAAVASKSDIYCITGDGSIQMNLQELQTIITNKLRVKIIVFNNGGYGAIVQTQTNFFGRLSGCTKESGVSCPNFELLANAYGYPYYRCEYNCQVESIVDQIIENNGCCICEVIDDGSQGIEPKQKSKSLPNGELLTPQIDDLYPFLEKSVFTKYSDYNKKCW